MYSAFAPVQDLRCLAQNLVNRQFQFITDFHNPITELSFAVQVREQVLLTERLQDLFHFFRGLFRGMV